jgi:hypothetical protein
MTQCNFQQDWAGRCTKETLSDSLFCEEHSKVKCSVCGKQATHTCPETFMLVCGTPLCDSCMCNCKGT